MDKVREIIAGNLIVSTLLYMFTMNANKEKTEKETQALITQWSNDSVNVLIDSLDKQGYHIVPKEPIPDAFLKM